MVTESERRGSAATWRTRRRRSSLPEMSSGAPALLTPAPLAEGVAWRRRTPAKAQAGQSDFDTDGFVRRRAQAHALPRDGRRGAPQAQRSFGEAMVGCGDRGAGGDEVGVDRPCGVSAVGVIIVAGGRGKRSNKATTSNATVRSVGVGLGL